MGRKKREFNRLRLDSGQHRRIMLVSALLGALAFLPVGLRLYNLMVTNYDYYSSLALRNQTRTTTVTADRGDIFDRNMNILATSVSVENVYLDPHELKQSKADIPEIARTLGEILGKDPAWIEEQAADIKRRYKQVGTRIDEETAGIIRDYINEKCISGIHLEPTSQRVYPYETLAAQVVGFTNASNEGCEGVEAAYNSFLAGSTGRVITTKGNNEMDMPFSYENYVSSRQGDSVILTLDATVQACLEKQLSAAIARYDVQNGAFGLVMNCKTGEILAMATLGSYDPNNYLEIADEGTAAQLEEMKRVYLAEPEGSEAYEAGKTAYGEDFFWIYPARSSESPVMGIVHTGGSNLIASCYAAWFRTAEKPVVMQPLYSIGLRVWMLVACCLINALKKNKQWLIAIPVLVLLVGLWLGTPVYSEFRYAYPMVLTSPFILVTTLYSPEKSTRP